MSAETQAVDEILEAIELATNSDALTPQECANVLAEIAEQVDAKLGALQEEGIEPE